MLAITIRPTLMEHTTAYTRCSWQRLPMTGVVTGIELTVRAERSGLVRDHMVVFERDRAAISANQANVLIRSHQHTYGSATDSWDMRIDLADMHQLTTLLQYLRGPNPTEDRVDIQSVELKLHYSLPLKLQ